MIAKDSKNRLFELMGRVNPSFINEDAVRGLTLNDYPTYITSNPEIQLNGNYIKLYHNRCISHKTPYIFLQIVSLHTIH